MRLLAQTRNLELTISGFRVQPGACHRAARSADPLGLPRNDDSELLPVIGQNFRAGVAQPCAVLLQAHQNDLVAVIDVGPAKTRDISRASIMPLLRRSHRAHQNKRNNEKKSGHLAMP